VESYRILNETHIMVLNFLKSSYKKVQNALTKTRDLIGNKVRSLFKGKWDERALEELEQVFYEADLGIETASQLTNKVRALHYKNPQLDSEALIAVMQEELRQILAPYSPQLVPVPKEGSPRIILVIGVNGNGKTTTVAKLTHYLKASGEKVLLAAGDTFRAAATEQLEMWAKRLGVEIVKGNPKSDPSSVVFDAIAAGKARGASTVIIDTAGRLHTKTALMQELEKIRRTCHKAHPNSPHETLLVLDGTTGQNAVDQAKTFHQFAPITGIVLTKLDGSAKGGVAIRICQQLKIPIKFMGVGEGVEDLEPFDADHFVKALFE
jgi:fused signal recognition particle receptor